jgi:hypothetical protein
MNLRAIRQPSQLPKRFPVGTTYIVEGHSGQDGRFRVSSRYVVLPSGARFSLAGDFGGQPKPRRVRSPLSR